jgi:hypothetical protein
VRALLTGLLTLVSGAASAASDDGSGRCSFVSLVEHLNLDTEPSAELIRVCAAVDESTSLPVEVRSPCASVPCDFTALLTAAAEGRHAASPELRDCAAVARAMRTGCAQNES